MGSHARTRWAAAALGFTGLLCAVLGAVMIVAVPSLIKQQVYKVGEGRRRGPELLDHGGDPSSTGGAAAPLPYPPRPRLRLGAQGAHLGSFLEAGVGKA